MSRTKRGFSFKTSNWIKRLFNTLLRYKIDERVRPGLHAPSNNKCPIGIIHASALGGHMLVSNTQLLISSQETMGDTQVISVINWPRIMSFVPREGHNNGVEFFLSRPTEGDEMKC